MENLPIDAIDLASRVFYSESEDKIYFGDPINGYFEVNTGQLSQVAFSGSYDDLDNLPTIPAQLNPTAGTGMSITGTYPNMTFSVNETVIPTFFIDVVLDKNDINNLHTTPITITNAMLGLEPGKGAKFLKEQLEVTIFTDGTDFSSTRPIQIGNGELNDIMSLDNSLYASALPDGTYAGGGMTSFLTYKVKDEYYITVADPITGGGDACYIKFRIYYHIVDSW